MWEYSDTLKDHFFNPRNVGELKDANAVAEVGSLACGDALKLYLKIDPETEKILDARFQTFGCGSAIASSSALTEMIKGKTIEEALKITNKDIAEYLGGLPVEKMHCSVMGREALEAAIARYRGGSAPTLPQEGKIVCTCFGVTDKTIERTIREHQLKTVDDVTHYCKAGGGCGSCHPQIEKMLQAAQGVAPETTAPLPQRTAPLTGLQRMKRIEEVIETQIRPMLRQDGGDIELVDVVGRTAVVTLRGTCRGCAMAGVTLQQTVEKKLRDYVGEEIQVEEAKP